MFNPPPLGPPSTERPKSGEYFWEHRMYIPCEFGVDRPTRFRDMDYAIFPHWPQCKNSTPPPQGPPWADHRSTTSFPSLVFALPWAKISRRSHHPALRYPQPYKQTKNKKSKLNITPNATLYGEIKSHDAPKKLRFANEIGERYGENEWYSKVLQPCRGSGGNRNFRATNVRLSHLLRLLLLIVGGTSNVRRTEYSVRRPSRLLSVGRESWTSRGECRCTESVIRWSVYCILL